MANVTKTAIAQALTQGRQQATEIIELRKQALLDRQTAVATHTQKMARAALAGPPTLAPAIKAATLQLLGSAHTAGDLVAEGDSWFNYPLTDVLQQLENHHAYDVHSVAHWGDRVEDMAYAGGQLTQFSRTLEKLLRRGRIPRAILLSGGGNDIVGEEFATLLNHATSPNPGLNDAIVTGVIDQRIRLAYVTILMAVTNICKQWTGQQLPILLHGYDYPVPDGRGFLGGFGPLPGPWMSPGFQAKGYADLTRRKAIVRELMDRFNQMISEVAAMSQFAHVTYVDLRGTLPTAEATYQDWWANELHPTRQGFKRVTNKFVAALDAL